MIMTVPCTADMVYFPGRPYTVFLKGFKLGLNMNTHESSAQRNSLLQYKHFSIATVGSVVRNYLVRAAQKP